VAALSEHLEEVVPIEIKDLKIDITDDTAIVFFSLPSEMSSSRHEPTFRAELTPLHDFPVAAAGWRAIHVCESALSTQSAEAMAAA
jgi:hypothetical protein